MNPPISQALTVRASTPIRGVERPQRIDRSRDVEPSALQGLTVREATHTGPEVAADLDRWAAQATSAIPALRAGMREPLVQPAPSISYRIGPATPGSLRLAKGI